MAKIVDGPSYKRLQKIFYATLPLGKLWSKKRRSLVIKLKLGSRSSLGKMKLYGAEVKVKVHRIEFKKRQVYFEGQVLASDNTKLQVRGKLIIDSKSSTSQGELHLVS